DVVLHEPRASRLGQPQDHRPPGAGGQEGVTSGAHDLSPSPASGGGLGRGLAASLCRGVGPSLALPQAGEGTIPSEDNLMTNHLNVSRRHMLAMSAAAGGLAATGIGRAWAQQPVKRIDQLDPVLDKIISTSEPINDIAEGMGGPLGPVEGPVWWKEGG